MKVRKYSKHFYDVSLHPEKWKKIDRIENPRKTGAWRDELYWAPPHKVGLPVGDYTKMVCVCGGIINQMRRAYLIVRNERVHYF